jgi:hypothetical protein
VNLTLQERPSRISCLANRNATNLVLCNKKHSHKAQVLRGQVVAFLTLAGEASGDWDAALLGNTKSDARHHALRSGQRLAHKRAQTSGSSDSLAHGGHIAATLRRWPHSTAPAGSHAGHHLEDVASSSLRSPCHLRGAEQKQAECSCQLMEVLVSSHLVES